LSKFANLDFQENTTPDATLEKRNIMFSGYFQSLPVNAQPDNQSGFSG
jgi:hypothetical protein